MIRPLETSRLLLRPLEVADAAQIQEIFPHWEIVRYLSPKVPWPYPEDGALIYCRDIALPASERGESWDWTLRLKADPSKLIGGISLFLQENNQRGFWLALSLHGQGLMTEAAIAVTDFWFEELNFPVLRVYKALENAASLRISEKCGMRVIATEERDYVSGRHLSQLCEITAEEWRNRRRKPEVQARPMQNRRKQPELKADG